MTYITYFIVAFIIFALLIVDNAACQLVLNYRYVSYLQSQIKCLHAKPTNIGNKLRFFTNVTKTSQQCCVQVFSNG